jgi:Ni,Fe-hydrogenase III component G
MGLDSAHLAGVHRHITEVTPDTLRSEAAALLADGFRLALVAGHDDGPTLRIVYLFLAGAPDRRRELQVSVPRSRPEIPSLAALSYPASRFERELHDLLGIVPVDHPLPRRLVRHAHWPAGWYPLRRDAGPPPPFTDGDSFPFLQVDGAGVRDPGRAGARRADRTRSLPVLRRRRDHHQAQSPLVVHPPRHRENVRGP